jgi:hypothetical protein
MSQRGEKQKSELMLVTGATGGSAVVREAKRCSTTNAIALVELRADKSSLTLLAVTARPYAGTGAGRAIGRKVIAMRNAPSPMIQDPI